MTDVDPDVYIAQARARQRAVSAHARAKLAQLGQFGRETAASPPAGLQTATRRPPKARRFEDLSASERARDAISARRITSLWKRHPRYAPRGRTTICLPSGRELVFDGSTGKVVSS